MLVKIAAIAIVLVAALIAYSVSSSYLNSTLRATFSDNSCVVQDPYVCSTPLITKQGTMQFTFVQKSGKVIYNVEVACLSTSNSLYNTPTSAGVQYLPLADLSAVPIGLNVTTGQQIVVASMPCYGASGAVDTSTGRRAIHRRDISQLHCKSRSRWQALEPMDKRQVCDRLPKGHLTS